MTREQLLFIFEELNSQFGENLYVEDTWLEMKEITHIILSKDESLFPDDRIQFRFDSETELVSSRKGYYEGEDFIPTGNLAVFSYSQIFGFMLEKATNRKAPYRFSASV